jgi:hypothetical protein
MAYHYFGGKRDIALAIGADGYLLFKRNRHGPSATPIMFQNCNLSLKIRTHLGNQICVGVIPPPHAPKDYKSFIEMVDEELAQLALGVQTFDVVDRETFLLRAYVITKIGDIVTIEKLLGINGYSPCCSCEIKGAQKARTGETNYYIPLRLPTN